jgi:hypothetical protein
MNADEHGWSRLAPPNVSRESSVFIRVHPWFQWLVAFSVLLLGAEHPARASLLWHWSLSGTGVSAIGTFTTGDAPDDQGFYRITGIAGTANGATITGL